MADYKVSFEHYFTTSKALGSGFDNKRIALSRFNYRWAIKGKACLEKIERVCVTYDARFASGVAVNTFADLLALKQRGYVGVTVTELFGKTANLLARLYHTHMWLAMCVMFFTASERQRAQYYDEFKEIGIEDIKINAKDVFAVMLNPMDVFLFSKDNFRALSRHIGAGSFEPCLLRSSVDMGQRVFVENSGVGVIPEGEKQRNEIMRVFEDKDVDVPIIGHIQVLEENFQTMTNVWRFDMGLLHDPIVWSKVCETMMDDTKEQFYNICFSVFKQAGGVFYPNFPPKLNVDHLSTADTMVLAYQRDTKAQRITRGAYRKIHRSFKPKSCFTLHQVFHAFEILSIHGYLNNRVHPDTFFSKLAKVVQADHKAIAKQERETNIQDKVESRGISTASTDSSQSPRKQLVTTIVERPEHRHRHKQISVCKTSHSPSLSSTLRKNKSVRFAEHNSVVSFHEDGEDSAQLSLMDIPLNPYTRERMEAAERAAAESAAAESAAAESAAAESAAAERTAAERTAAESVAAESAAAESAAAESAATKGPTAEPTGECVDESITDGTENTGVDQHLAPTSQDSDWTLSTDGDNTFVVQSVPFPRPRPIPSTLYNEPSWDLYKAAFDNWYLTGKPPYAAAPPIDRTKRPPFDNYAPEPLTLLEFARYGAVPCLSRTTNYGKVERVEMSLPWDLAHSDLRLESEAKIRAMQLEAFPGDEETARCFPTQRQLQLQEEARIAKEKLEEEARILQEKLEDEEIDRMMARIAKSLEPYEEYWAEVDREHAKKMAKWESGEATWFDLFGPHAEQIPRPHIPHAELLDVNNSNSSNTEAEYVNHDTEKKNKVVSRTVTQASKQGETYNITSDGTEPKLMSLESCSYIASSNKNNVLQQTAAVNQRNTIANETHNKDMGVLTEAVGEQAENDVAEQYLIPAETEASNILEPVELHFVPMKSPTGILGHNGLAGNIAEVEVQNFPVIVEKTTEVDMKLWSQPEAFSPVPDLISEGDTSDEEVREEIEESAEIIASANMKNDAGSAKTHKEKLLDQKITTVSHDDGLLVANNEVAEMEEKAEDPICYSYCEIELGPSIVQIKDVDLEEETQAVDCSAFSSGVGFHFDERREEELSYLLPLLDKSEESLYEIPNTDESLALLGEELYIPPPEPHTDEFLALLEEGLYTPPPVPDTDEFLALLEEGFYVPPPVPKTFDPLALLEEGLFVPQRREELVVKKVPAAVVQIVEPVCNNPLADFYSRFKFIPMPTIEEVDDEYYEDTRICSLPILYVDEYTGKHEDSEAVVEFFLALKLLEAGPSNEVDRYENGQPSVQIVDTSLIMGPQPLLQWLKDWNKWTYEWYKCTEGSICRLFADELTQVHPVCNPVVPPVLVAERSAAIGITFEIHVLIHWLNEWHELKVEWSEWLGDDLERLFETEIPELPIKTNSTIPNSFFHGQPLIEWLREWSEWSNDWSEWLGYGCCRNSKKLFGTEYWIADCDDDANLPNVLPVPKSTPVTAVILVPCKNQENHLPSQTSVGSTGFTPGPLVTTPNDFQDDGDSIVGVINYDPTNESLNNAIAEIAPLVWDFLDSDSDDANISNVTNANISGNNEDNDSAPFIFGDFLDTCSSEGGNRNHGSQVNLTLNNENEHVFTDFASESAEQIPYHLHTILSTSTPNNTSPQRVSNLLSPIADRSVKSSNVSSIEGNRMQVQWLSESTDRSLDLQMEWVSLRNEESILEIHTMESEFPALAGIEEDITIHVTDDNVKEPAPPSFIVTILFVFLSALNRVIGPASHLFALGPQEVLDVLLFGVLLLLVLLMAGVSAILFSYVPPPIPSQFMQALSFFTIQPQAVPASKVEVLIAAIKQQLKSCF